MRAWQLSLLLLLLFCGCSDGFSGERGRLEFDTTLERQSLDWTPSQPVMLGSRFFVQFDLEGFCLVDCPTLTLDGGRATGSLELLSFAEVLAAREGDGVYEVTGRDTDRFSVRVVAPQALTLHDPLALNQLEWRRYGVDAGGVPFPDVGEEVVVGEHASVVLDVAPRSREGVVLGTSQGTYVIGSSDDGVRIGPRAADLRQVEVHAGDAGATGRIEAALADGGLASTWSLRVASVDEVADVRLVPVSANALPPGNYLVRAIVTRADGGLFLEAPLSWRLPEGVTPVEYGTRATFGLTDRKDVMLFRYDGVDSGVLEVFARVGDHVAVADVSVTGRDVIDEEPPPAPPPAQPGCSSAPASALVVLALALQRRRRASHASTSGT